MSRIKNPQKLSPTQSNAMRHHFASLKQFLALPAVLAALAVASSAANASAQAPLEYRDSKGTVDLGVGLWAWPLPIDFDGDGDLDLVVSCPDKPYNGLYFFENPGDAKLPVFKPGRRIGKGLQNVAISYVDGKPRILGPAMEYPDFVRNGLENGVELPLPANVHPNRVRGNFWRYVDYDGDGNLDIVVGADDWTDFGWDNGYDAAGKWTRGPLRGFIYCARNTGSTATPHYETPVKITAGKLPAETYGWPAPNFADFDFDGDLDLLCGEFLDGFTYFQNTGTRTQPEYAPGKRLQSPDGKRLAMDLQMITPSAIDWDHDGDIDLVVGDEDGRVALVEHTGKIKDGLPQFLRPQYFQQQAALVKFGALVTPVGCDWDGDGDIDIVSGNTAGYLGFIENISAAGVDHPQWAAPKLLSAAGTTVRIQAGPNGSIQGPCEAKWGYTTLSVADWDGDGLPDLVVNSIWGKVHWYRNIGSRTAPKLGAPQPIEVEWQAPQPQLAWGWLRPEGKSLLTQWRTTPVAIDWNHDGLCDLVMLDHEGYLAWFERKRDSGGALTLLPPQRVFHWDSSEAASAKPSGPMQLNEGAAGKSGRRKLCTVDWDGDGQLDILINGENATWLRQVSNRDGTWFFRDMGSVGSRKLAGHDTSPTTVDFNADGIPDLLIGAEDGHFYYQQNSRTKAR